MEDIPSLGLMKVSREVYEWCACDDGYVWTVTFMGLRGEVKTMTTISELAGPGATITDTAVVRNSTEISGTFQLTYGHEEGGSIRAPPPRVHDPHLNLMPRPHSQSHRYCHAATLGDDVNHPDLGKKLTTRELAYDSDNEIMRIALEQGNNTAISWAWGLGFGRM